MNFVNYMHYLEPIQEHVTRFYSTTSEIITVLLVIWLLNFFAGMVHRTYSSGKALGGIYWKYFHKYIKSLNNLVMTFLQKRLFGPAKSENKNCTVRQIY